MAAVIAIFVVLVVGDEVAFFVGVHSLRTHRIYHLTELKTIIKVLYDGVIRGPFPQLS